MGSFRQRTAIDCVLFASLLALGCARQPVSADDATLTKAIADDSPASQIAAGEAENSKPAKVCAPFVIGDTTCTVDFSKPPRLGETTIDEWVEQLRHRPYDELLDHPEQALPILLAAIKDEKAARWVWHMLAVAPQTDKLNGAPERDLSWALPLYAAQLRSGDFFAKWRAISAIEKFGPAAWRLHPSLVDDLIVAAADGKSGDNLMSLLNKIEIPTEQAIRVMAAVYDAQRDEMSGRFDRERILHEMVKRGPLALPKLLEITANSDGYHQFTPQHLKADWTAPLVEQMESSEVIRRRGAARLSASLVKHLPADAEGRLQAALLQHCTDEDASVRGYVLASLERRPPLPAEAAARLIVCFAEESNRYHVAQTVAKIGPTCLPELREAAISPNEGHRVGAVSAIGAMKPVPLSEVPLLAYMTKDESPTVRCYAVYALQHAEFATPELLAALTTAFDDPESNDWAARALGELGPRASAALPQMLAKIDGAEIKEKVNLAVAILRIDPSSPVPMAALIEGLQDRQAVNAGYYSNSKIVNGETIETCTPYTRLVACAAANALADIGPAATPAVDVLIEAAIDENQELSSAAIRALGKIGPAANAAAPMLAELVKSNGPKRDTALQALRGIEREPAKPADPNDTAPATGVYRYSITDAADDATSR